MLQQILFKKCEVWIVLLLVMVGVVAMLAYGIIVRQVMLDRDRFGSIGRSAFFLAKLPEHVERALAGGAVGLRTKEQRFESRQGFSLYDESAPPDGFLLLSRYDGDRQRSVVELVDLSSFSVRHTWAPDIDAINDQVEKKGEFRHLERDRNQSRYRMEHPLLLRDGSLTFKNRTTPLVQVDACSNLVFQNTTDAFHHSTEADGDGNIWVPTRIFPSTIKRWGDRYADHALTKLSPEGEILYQRSVTDLLIKSGLQHEMYTYDGYVRDIVHLNDIQPALSDGPYWNKGDVFFSLAHLNMVALFRPGTDQILWWTQRLLNHQHDVDIVNDHEISIYDNNRVMSLEDDVIMGSNELLVYDFVTDEFRSPYGDGMREQDVRTSSGGLGDVLPNGNAFIEETDHGRVLELSTSGNLVWDYVNRASDGFVYVVSWSRPVSRELASTAMQSIAMAECASVQ